MPNIMNAQYIVDKVGKGVTDALKTNQSFLGIEQFYSENANIRPEYVMTVKIAEKLTAADFIVILEAPMKELKWQSSWLDKAKNKDNKNFKYEKENSERLDILVRSPDNFHPPHLMAEIKLGTRNLVGVTKDIDRICELLSMYESFGAFENHDIYGAVIFHAMKEKVGEADLKNTMDDFITKIEKHCETLKNKHMWLKYKAGLLSNFKIIEGASGSQVCYDNGAVENVLDKVGFAFMPGLVLLGNADDVEEAVFSQF